METALAVLGQVIEVGKLVAQPIKRQLNYLCCFTSNINGLKDEDKRLDDALVVLEGEVERGRDNVQEPVPQVKTWLAESKNIKDEINGILNEAENVGSGCSKLGARFSLSKRAKKTTERTEKLRGEKPKAEFLPPPIAAMQGVQEGKTVEFESRKKIEEDIMTALRGGDVNMLGIHGMGGLGKTTMAKKLMNRVLKEHVFDEVVMAVVSQNVDILKIQDEIGGQLGLEKLKEEKSESARVKILHSRLSDSKRTLLVLDDVWGKLVLEEFGIPRDSKGCRILLTSRNSDVLRGMNVQTFGMNVLSEEEAWSFFREKAGTCVDDRELNPIAKQVVKECGGLPLALAVVSAELKDQHSAAIWKNALREMEQCVPDTVPFDKEVYNPLKWSYNRLKSKPAQSIFLLCCLFPDDADIPLEYLTCFSMGLRIFKGITNMEDARNNMCALTQKLKDRCLLLESDEEDCVRMHDVVRDVCTVIAKEEGYIGKDGCTWISSSHLVGERNEFLSGSRCPNLNLLFLNSAYDSSGFKFDDAFLEGMRELHVLCIRNYSLTILPHPTQSLGNLNTLILDSCWGLKTISVVGELENLEILICRHCTSIEELPSEMKGLNRLKVLELTNCVNLQSIGRGIISSLVAVEELKMCGSFDRWEAEDREGRENASIKELEALPNLACVEIDIEDSSVLTENMPLLSKKIVRFIIRINSQYIPSKFSKAMSLRLERETRLGDWIQMQLLRDTEYLDLGGDGANNVDLAKSQNIRWLELSQCESMKNVGRTSGGSDDATVFFPSIEYLKLESLDSLQEICDGPISSTSFQNLKELQLRRCNSLMQFWKSRSVCENNNVPHFSNLSSIDIWECDSLCNLGQLSMAGKDCLPQLEKLSVSYCSMMEHVFLWNDEEVITKVFPKLMEVELYKLPNLTTLCQGIQGTEFPLLRNMKIQYCPKMKSIIKSCNLGQLSMAGKDCLPQLEELSIIGCSMMEQVFLWNDDQEAGGNKTGIESQQKRHVIFPKLKEVKLVFLPNLTTFYQGIQGIEFPLLMQLHIEECPKMKSIIIGSSSVDIDDDDSLHLLCQPQTISFGSLEVLDINHNPICRHEIPSSLFNGLKELTISEYVGSESLFTLSVAANLVCLRILCISECDEMTKVIEDEQQQQRILAFPKLEILKLEYLPKLVSFCDSKCEVELPSLREVVIFDCPNMENFSLGLVATPNLEAFTTDLTTYVGVGVDVAFNSLKKLEIELNENPWYDDKISVSLFNGLEELRFFSYKGSMSLFSSSAVWNLVNLKVMRLTYSDEMLVKVIKDEEEKITYSDEMLVKVIQDKEEKEDEKVVVSGGEIITSVVIFPKLEELRLWSLPKLVRFCEWKCDVELPSLTKVAIYNCPNMESFSMGFVAAPNLKIVEIDFKEMDATKGLNAALQQHYVIRRGKEVTAEKEAPSQGWISRIFNGKNNTYFPKFSYDY